MADDWECPVCGKTILGESISYFPMEDRKRIHLRTHRLLEQNSQKDGEKK